MNKALEKDRTLRYQNAADVRTDLARLRREMDSGHSSKCDLSGAGPAQPGSAVDSTRVPVATNSKKYLLGGFATALLVIAAATGFYVLRGNNSIQKGNSIAVLPFVNATSDPNNRVSERWSD